MQVVARRTNLQSSHKGIPSGKYLSKTFPLISSAAHAAEERIAADDRRRNGARA
jgi:hypothetical protein